MDENIDDLMKEFLNREKYAEAYTLYKRSQSLLSDKNNLKIKIIFDFIEITKKENDILIKSRLNIETPFIHNDYEYTPELYSVMKQLGHLINTNLDISYLKDAGNALYFCKQLSNKIAFYCIEITEKDTYRVIIFPQYFPKFFTLPYNKKLMKETRLEEIALFLTVFKLNAQLGSSIEKWLRAKPLKERILDLYNKRLHNEKTLH